MGDLEAMATWITSYAVHSECMFQMNCCTQNNASYLHCNFPPTPSPGPQDRQWAAAVDLSLELWPPGRHNVACSRQDSVALALSCVAQIFKKNFRSNFFEFFAWRESRPGRVRLPLCLFPNAFPKNLWGRPIPKNLFRDFLFVQRDCSCWIFRGQTLQLLNILEQSQVPTQA